MRYTRGMIRINTDENVHEADLELIRDYADALVEKDKLFMIEVLYLTEQRMDGSCRCYEVNCICEER